MIVFVKVSPRRYIAIDTTRRETGWRGLPPDLQQPPKPPSGQEQGLIYATGAVIAGPANWTTCERRAIEYAIDRAADKVWTAAAWEAEQATRAAAIKADNDEIRARQWGIGAALRNAGKDR